MIVCTTAGHGVEGHVARLRLERSFDVVTQDRKRRDDAAHGGRQRAAERTRVDAGLVDDPGLLRGVVAVDVVDRAAG
jgi:hypothetical protein